MKLSISGALAPKTGPGIARRAVATLQGRLLSERVRGAMSRPPAEIIKYGRQTDGDILLFTKPNAMRLGIGMLCADIVKRSAEAGWKPVGVRVYKGSLLPEGLVRSHYSEIYSLAKDAMLSPEISSGISQTYGAHLDRSDLPESALALVPALSLIEKGFSEGYIKDIWEHALSLEGNMGSSGIFGVKKIGPGRYVCLVEPGMTLIHNNFRNLAISVNYGRPFLVQNGFYLGLRDMLLSEKGRIVCFALRPGKGAMDIDSFRETVVGATDPRKARALSLRALYGLDVSKNAVHCSESLKEAQRELSLWFDPSLMG